MQLVAGDIYRLLDLPAGCIFTWPGEKGGETAGAGVRQARSCPGKIRGNWEASGNFVFCADLISQLKTFHNCKRQHATGTWSGGGGFTPALSGQQKRGRQPGETDGQTAESGSSSGQAAGSWQQHQVAAATAQYADS